MSFSLGHVRVTVRFSLVLVLAVLPFLGGRLPLLLFWAVFLHETGHLLYILARGFPIKAVECSLAGVKIALGERTLSLRETVLLNLLGPLMNFLSGWAALLLFPGVSVWRFAAVSFLLGGLNLLPLGETDGMELLSAVLIKAGKGHILPRVRLFLSVLVLFAILLLLLKNGWSWFYLLPIGYFIGRSVEEMGAI